MLSRSPQSYLQFKGVPQAREEKSLQGEQWCQLCPSGAEGYGVDLGRAVWGCYSALQTVGLGDRVWLGLVMVRVLQDQGEVGGGGVWSHCHLGALEPGPGKRGR